MHTKFVSYLRVSTPRQGESGLGLEAQQEAVRRFLGGSGSELAREFVEVESGRKGVGKRPELIAALNECKRQRAILIVAKLDRLARDVRFFLEVLDDYGVDVKFVEFADIDPKTDEGRMILVGMANFAEFEGRRIGSRTKAALAAAKARGVVLGKAGPANLKRNIEQRQQVANDYAAKLRPMLDSMKARGLSQRAMAEELNSINVPTPQGGRWRHSQIQRTLSRNLINLDAASKKFQTVQIISPQLSTR